MKLYTINSYGVNMAVGATEEDAIMFYLHRHPELQVVEEIEEKLEATEVLGDFNFAELFRMLHNQAEDGDARDEMMMKTIDKYTTYKYMKGFNTQEKFHILVVLQWMQEGMTIYGDDISFKDLIYNNFPFDELMKLL